jgi:4'-phosphopantetheinyl transferase
MIYLFDDMENIPADVIRDTFPLMPPERQQRALRFRQERDRNACVLAYGLLLHGLEQEYGITAPPAFSYGENGKPYLTDHPSIYFNLSHCKAGIVCAISDMEVGVDIQEVRPIDMDVVRRVCTSYEVEQFQYCQLTAPLFCKIWTIKEGFIKWFGGSIAQPLNYLDAQSLCNQADRYLSCHWGNGYHVCCFGIVDCIVNTVSFENDCAFRNHSYARMMS